MFRFLKWIFLIFGGLALSIISFFTYQNRIDLGKAYQYYDILDYKYQVHNCADKEGYNYPCFEEDFREYAKEVSLTGLSIGLKFAFNYIEKEKETVTRFPSIFEKNIAYTLHYLELNNIAIDHCNNRFFGFEFLYSGYLGSVRDYITKAEQFSKNLIMGLEGPEGITQLPVKELQSKYQNKLQKIKKNLNLIVKKSKESNQVMIDELLKRAAQANSSK